MSLQLIWQNNNEYDKMYIICILYNLINVNFQVPMFSVSTRQETLMSKALTKYGSRISRFSENTA